MRTQTKDEFLAWTGRAGFRLDLRYPHSAVLAFDPDPQEDRFWLVPEAPEERPYFISSLIELMGDWQSCRVWRHLGRWPASADPRQINDVVELRILEGLGVPLGTADILEFFRAESDKLITLLFETTIFGWSVADDLYVVPDHGRHFLQTDHHGVVHVRCRDAADLNRWIMEMERKGFSLPDEIPDSTFKQPDWMQQNDE